MFKFVSNKIIQRKDQLRGVVDTEFNGSEKHKGQ